MNIEHYTYLLANPQEITSTDVGELDVLLQKYPYFQSARALQLKGLKNQESYRYNDALKLTAAHTTDRDILFEYITSDKFVQNEISQNILLHDDSLVEIEVEAENVSEQINKEEIEQINAERQMAEAILNPNLFERKQDSIEEIIESEQIKEELEVEPTEEVLMDSEKPLDFTKKDTYSFSEWLKLTKAQPIDRGEENPSEEPESDVSKDEKERKFELIDRFIQGKPKITPAVEAEKTTEFKELTNLATTYMQSPDSLMTETLAKVYLQQKNYKKAIQAYKILILKNPEKSGFFADQIRAIEKMINPEQS